MGNYCINGDVFRQKQDYDPVWLRDQSMGGSLHGSAWTVSGKTGLDFRGYHVNNYLPTVSLSFEAVQDVNSLSRYDLYSSIDVTFKIFSDFNLSVGYSSEHLSSIPPEYEDISNGSNYVKVTYRF